MTEVRVEPDPDTERIRLVRRCAGWMAFGVLLGVGFRCTGGMYALGFALFAAAACVILLHPATSFLERADGVIRAGVIRTIVSGALGALIIDRMLGSAFRQEDFASGLLVFLVALSVGPAVFLVFGAYCALAGAATFCHLLGDRLVKASPFIPWIVMLLPVVASLLR